MKIMVAMSGGVDSSVSVAMLKEAGHDVRGVYMILHKNDEYHRKNIQIVRKVGEYFGIKTDVLDLQNKFSSMVYEPFINTYRAGKTPNPCALCNRFIKLGALLDFAFENGCERLATGHYARIIDGHLCVAKDESKDQSYFLSNACANSLKSVIFPLGEYYKSDIKAFAMAHPQISFLASQKESSEICFVENSYIDVLNRHFNTLQKGVVRDMDGQIVGEHDGFARYTIGKRRGFSVAGAHEPHYVAKIDAQNNEIWVGSRDDLAVSEFLTLNFNELLNVGDEFECFVKIRYRSPKTRAKVRILRENSIDLDANFDKNIGVKPAVNFNTNTKNSTNAVCKITLNTPAYGVASGQLCAFYDENDRVIGSGFIA